jgi:hypothetical protein
MRRIGVAVGVAAGVLGAVLLVSLLLRGRNEGPPDAVEAAAELPERRIRVEVLNAAGIPRLAQRGTDQLRDGGFDVVYFGNARGFHRDTSLVLDRVGDPAAAAAVAEAIGIERVRSEPDTSLYLEATVVLGRDWVGVEAGDSVR